MCIRDRCVCVCVLVPQFPLPFLEPVASVHQLAVTKQRDKEWTQPQIIKHHFTSTHTRSAPGAMYPAAWGFSVARATKRMKMLSSTTYCTNRVCVHAVFCNQNAVGISEDMSKIMRIIRRKMVLQQMLFHHWYQNPMCRVLNRAHSPSLAAVTSLVSLAITLQAASCWYRAWDNSAAIQESPPELYDKTLFNY